ncbi:hypothetical protein BZB76_1479 [Actinomadura pelletieri DSM 43383]|uniref:Uncharacterized protein n=1 Tax=Actinomadura pelletieri DSM 43383 TaxID=1120940 RepID=A0A495QRK2_9ACTN|nr:hypothetical protein [Actinomadura pelletieri]RKS76129.1 hypothetical protein BZB76_1479 [Actinomadura pelletieri DSM 43383]
MSGPRDTRESTDSAGTCDVPAGSVPPAFGAVPPVDAPPADASPASPFKPAAFGLEAPWWAAETTETADTDVEADRSDRQVPADEADEGDEIVVGAETAGERPDDPETTDAVPPGTLVAGVGVPNVDSRRAVPAEPIVKRPFVSGDTDPDGIPAVGPDEDAPEVKETVVDVVDQPSEAPSAFQKAREAEDATSAALSPVLVPDAILPPGVTPPTGSGAFPNSATADKDAAPAEALPANTPTFHAEGGLPIDTLPPTLPRRFDLGGERGRPRLIGASAAVILTATIALFILGGTGSGKDQDDKGEDMRPPVATQPAPAPTSTPVDISDEKTDTKDLAFRDVFPTETITLGGRTYTRERWSLNRDVSYAARGSMLEALERAQCRKIVRATFIDRERNLAVTSGIAVMPTREAAITISKAGDPAKYEWFRGLGGKNAPDLDRAGGYAAATFRGRYVAYAYVQRADGKKAEPGDPMIKQVAQQFLDYDLSPIVARTQG